MTSPRRLLAISGTRADFGLWLPVIKEVGRRPQEATIGLVVTGMHLDPRFGSTADEVRASGVSIAAEFPSNAAGDSPSDMAESLGRAIVGMAEVLAAEAPDWVCLLGDRGEQLAGALVALHLGLPIAHLHGGERSLGVVDDTLRDMISRAAHLHLTANAEAAARLTRMGEEEWRIRIVGAPGLDDLVDVGPAAAELRAAYGLPPEGPYLLVVQHPETIGEGRPMDDLEATIAAVLETGAPALAVGPNADAGGRTMLERLQALHDAQVTFRASVPRPDYLALLAGASALVGNSSSGLIEAPMLGVPTVMVGDRQRGRTRGDNVVDVPASREAIAEGLRRAMDPSFRRRLSRTSPYGDGHAAPAIIDAILSQSIDARLLIKEVAP